MLKGRLFWHLFPSYLLITAAALLTLGIYARYSLKGFYYDHIADDLLARAHLLQRQVIEALEQGDFGAVDELCKEMGRTSGTRITVILPEGMVIADSQEAPEQMADHSDRPEIKDALSEGFGRSTRFSNTLGKRMMYVAVPVEKDGKSMAVIRTSLPVTAIDEKLGLIYSRFLWGLLIVTIAAGVIDFALSRRLSKPIEQMTQTAKRFASGRLDVCLPIPKSSDLAALATALNEMAEQLNQRIDTITRQRNESEAILQAMVEGVIAIDGQGHIVSVNNAAASLLAVEKKDVIGRSIEETVRNPEIQNFVKDMLEDNAPEEINVFLQTDGRRCFQVHGARLGEAEAAAGAVIVLNDITRMRRLEVLRSDFVANVSHELKTPITSIKGFVETLLEGRPKDPQQVRRFLKIISRHTDRLNAIIEDLLSLSSLETEEQQRNISFETQKIKPVILSAVEFSRMKAEEKKINIDVLCDDDIEAPVNAPLLEQAVLNLVDNAIKYSNAGDKINVIAARSDNEIRISIEDHGCGIEKRQLSRIFERFYVVDKARSRKLGGTGLGLAIVKHVCQVHRGRVTVDSTPGEGSTFTIHLPK